MKNRSNFIDYVFKICMMLMCLASFGFSTHFTGYRTYYHTKFSGEIVLGDNVDRLEQQYAIDTVLNRGIIHESQNKYIIRAKADGVLTIDFQKADNIDYGNKHCKVNGQPAEFEGVGFVFMETQVEDNLLKLRETKTYVHSTCETSVDSEGKTFYPHNNYDVDEIRSSFFYEWNSRCQFERHKDVKRFKDTTKLTQELKAGKTYVLYVGFLDNCGNSRLIINKSFFLKFETKPVCKEAKEHIKLEKKYDFKSKYKYTISGKLRSFIKVVLPNNIKQDKKYKLLYNLQEDQNFNNYSIIREKNFKDCFDNTPETTKNGILEGLEAGETVYIVIESKDNIQREYNFDFKLIDEDGNIPQIDQSAQIGGGVDCKKADNVTFFDKDKNGAYINQYKLNLSSDKPDSDSMKFVFEVKTKVNGHLIIDSSNKNIKQFVISDSADNCGTTGKDKFVAMKNTDTKYIGVEIKGKGQTTITADFIPDDLGDLDSSVATCNPLNPDQNIQENGDNVVHLGKKTKDLDGYYNEMTFNPIQNNGAKDGVVTKYWVKVKAEMDGIIKLNGKNSSFTITETNKANSANCFNDDGKVIEKIVKKGDEYYVGVKVLGKDAGELSIKLISDKLINDKINCGNTISHKFTSTTGIETKEYKDQSVQVLLGNKKVRNFYKFTVPTYGYLKFSITNKTDKDKARVFRYDTLQDPHKDKYQKKCGQSFIIPSNYSIIDFPGIDIETKMISTGNNIYEIIFIVDTEQNTNEVSSHNYDVEVIWSPNPGDSQTDGGSKPQDEQGDGDFAKDIPDAITNEILDPNEFNDNKAIGRSASVAERDLNLIWGGAGTFLYGDMLTASTPIFDDRGRNFVYTGRIESRGYYLKKNSNFTKNSASAKIKLPHGLKGNQVKIKYARLFWQGHIWSNSINTKYQLGNLIRGYRDMQFAVGNGEIHNINATMVNHRHVAVGGDFSMIYGASADVTNIVSNYIENSNDNVIEFTGGNIKATEGIESGTLRNLSATPKNPFYGTNSRTRLGPSGGWSIIVVYEVREDKFTQDKFLEIAKPKQVSIFAGYKVLSGLQDKGDPTTCPYEPDIKFGRYRYCFKNLEVPVFGFYTPDTDDFDAKVTMTAGLGDFANGVETREKYPVAMDQLRINTTYKIENGAYIFDKNKWITIDKEAQNTFYEDLDGKRHTYEGATGDDSLYRPMFDGGYSSKTYQIGPSAKKFLKDEKLKDNLLKARYSAVSFRFSLAAGDVSSGGMSDDLAISMIAMSTDLYMPDICYDENIYNTAGWLKFFNYNEKSKKFERVKKPGGVPTVKGAIVENEPLYYRVMIKNRQKAGKSLGTIIKLKLGATNTYQPNSMAIDNKSAVSDEYSSDDHSKFDIKDANFVYIKDKNIGAYSDIEREKVLDDEVYNGRQFNDASGTDLITVPVGHGAGKNLGGGTLRSNSRDKVFFEFNATAGKYYKYIETTYKAGFKAVDDQGNILANFDYGLPIRRCTPKTESIDIVKIEGLQITNKNYKKDGDDDSIYTQIAGKNFDVKLIYQPDMTRVFPCLDPEEEKNRIKAGKACTIYDLDLIEDRFLKEYFKCDVPKGQIASNVCTEDQKRGKTLKNGLQKFKLEGPLYLSLIDARNKQRTSGTQQTSDKEEIFGCNKYLIEENYLVLSKDGKRYSKEYKKDKKYHIADPLPLINEDGKNMMFNKEMIDLKNLNIDDAYKNATFMLTYYPVGLDKNTTQDFVDNNQTEESKLDASNAKVALQVGQGPDGSFKVCNSDDFSIRPAFLKVNKVNIKGSAYLLNNKTNELKVINDKPRVGGKFEDNKDLLTTILQPVSYGGEKLFGYKTTLSTNFHNSAELRGHIQTGKYYKDLTEDQKYRENKIYLRPYISKECRDVGYIPQFYYSSTIDGVDDNKVVLNQNSINLDDNEAVKNCFYNKTEADCLPHYKEQDGKCYLDRSTITDSSITNFYCYSPYQYSDTFNYLEDGINNKYLRNIEFKDKKYNYAESKYYVPGALNRIWNMDKIGVTLEFGKKCNPNKDGGCFDTDKTQGLPEPEKFSKISNLILAINSKDADCTNNFNRKAEKGKKEKEDYRGCQDSFITTQKIDNNESIFNYYNVGDVELRVVDNSWVSAAHDDIVGDREASCIINSSTNIEDDKGRIGCDIAIKDDVKGDELSLILRYIPDRIEIKTTGLENGGSYEYDGNKLSSNFTFFTRPSLVRDGKDLRILTNLGYGIRNNKAIVQNTQNLARVKFQTQAFIAGPKQNGRTVYKYLVEGEDKKVREQPLIATLFDGQVKRIYDGANYHKVPICGFAFDVPTNLEFKFDCDDAKYANDERCLTNAEIKKEVIEKLSFTKRQYKPFYNMSYEVSFPNGSYFKDCVGKNAKFDSRCFVTGTMSNKNGEEHESETQIHIPLKYAINYYSDYSEQSGIINSYDSTFNFFNPKSSAYTFIKEGFKGGKGESLSAYINFDRSEKIAMLPVWVEGTDFELTRQKDTNGKIIDKINFTLKTPRFDKDGNLVNSTGKPINYSPSGKDIGAGNEYDIINSSDIVDMMEQRYTNIDMNITTQNLEHKKDELVNRIKDSALFVYGALNHEGSLTKLTPISAKLSGNASNATEVRFENFIYCPANNNCDYIPLVNDAGQNYVDVLPNTIKDANNMVFKHITQIAPSRAKDPSSGFIKNPFNLFDNSIRNFAIDYVTDEPRLEIQRANQFDPVDITKDNKFVSEKVKMQKKTSTSNAFSTKPGETYLQVKPWYVYSKNMGTSSRTYGNPYLYGETDMRNHFIVRFTSISEWAGRGGASGGSDKNVGNVAGGKDLNMTSSRTQRRSNW